MNIAVNTRLLINDLHGGIEWFTYECLKRITINNPEHSFYFIFDRNFNSKFIFSDNVQGIVLGPKAIHPVIWHYWMEHKVAPFLKSIKADIFISPDGALPINTDTPCLPVIHDINFMHRRRDLPFLKSIYFRKQFRKFAEKASRIATVSEYSKNDLINTWQLDPSRIDVVYNGVSEKFFPQKDTDNNNRPEKPYFLFVGNLSPRKNIPNLIRAYNRFRDRVQEEYQLVIAGERFFLNGEVDRLITNSDYKDEIILTGKKTPDELRLLYSNAIALVFVPWFEGFGIPLLEAMKCACPVICSDTTSMPEIAGDAAVLVKPDNPEMIADEMYRLISNPDIRESRIEIGYRQAEQFSWDNTASDLWNSVLKSLNNN